MFLRGSMDHAHTARHQRPEFLLRHRFQEHNLPLQTAVARLRLQLGQRFAVFRQALIEPARDHQLNTVKHLRWQVRAQRRDRLDCQLHVFSAFVAAN